MASVRLLRAAALGALLAVGCNSNAPTEAPPVSKEPETAALVPKVVATAPPAETAADPAPAPSAVPAVAEPVAAKPAEKVAPKTSAAVKEPPAAAPAAKTPTAVASAPSPPPANAPIKRGAAVSGDGYSVWLETRSVHAVGQDASVTAVITAKSPYKCNDKYPYKLKLDPPSAGVSYPTPVVSGAQVGKERATMPFSVSTSAKGTPVVSGTLSFSVCTEDRCLVEKQKLSVAFAVE